MVSLPIILQAFLLSTMALGTAAPLPQEEDKATLIQDDLDFAVDMARYRYFDLADDYVEKIKEGHLSDKEKETLLITNAQILKLASEHAADDNERLAFYNESIQLFKEFVEYNTNHPRFDEVRIDLAEVYQNLGKFLTDQMEQSKDEEEKKTIRTRAEEIFREAVQLYNDVARSLREKSELEQDVGNVEKGIELFNLSRQCNYKRGMTYYYWGLIYPKEEFNREDYLTRAIDALDDYIWDSPEDDFYVLWAYVYQAMAYMELGNFSDALDLTQQVYDPLTGIDLDQAKDLAPEYAKLITDLYETAIYQVARIHYRMGEFEKVDETVNKLINDLGSRGFELSPLGDMARLEQARALLEMNDAEKTDKAAQICKEVGDRNPSNTVGRDAKVMLKNIIERPTVTAISPDVLFAAAEGSRTEGKFLEAVRGYLKVLRSAQTVQQKNEYNAKTWYAIGQCYLKLTRYMEAAIAFNEGFTDPDRGQDSKMYEANASNWYTAWLRRSKETRDPFDEAKKKEAQQRLVSLGVSSDLPFILARDKFAKAAGLEGAERESLLDEALTDFLEMDKQSTYYERAFVYAGRCYFEMGKYDEALMRFDEFRDYIKKAPPAGTKQQRTNRTSALAEEAFWRSETYLRLERYEEAENTLKDFESEFNTQSDFFPAVVYNRIMARLGQGDFQTAEAIYNTLKKNYPDSVRTPSAAYYIGYAAIEKAQEVRGENTEGPPPKEYLPLLRKGTEYMNLYCELSGYDSFVNLKNVCEWQKELGDLGEKGAYETARASYEKLLKEFGKDEQYKEEIESSVYRGFGDVLLNLRDFEKAKPIWLKLLSDNTKSVTILRSTAFCLGGWLEQNDQDYTEIPGTGDYAPDPSVRQDKISLSTSQGIWSYLLNGIEDRGAKYSNEWWEAKFYTVYARYRAGDQYPAYLDLALRLIDNQRLFQPDMGGKEWRSKFSYVEKAAKEKKRKR